LSQGAIQVLFGGTAATEVLSWSNTRIVVRVPVALSAAPVQVSLSEPAGQSNALPFTVTSTPYVLSVAPRLAVQNSNKVRVINTTQDAVTLHGQPEAQGGIGTRPSSSRSSRTRSAPAPRRTATSRR